MQERAIVLRPRPYRESDVIVECLTANSGRISALARSARKSQKRFGAALSTGAIIDVELSRRGQSGLFTLKNADVISLPKNVMSQLERYYLMAYALELGRLGTVEGRSERAAFELIELFLSLLEGGMPRHEELCLWEFSLLRTMGYGLQFWPCVVTGADPTGFSLHRGGAVGAVGERPSDYEVVPAEALTKFQQLNAGRLATLDAVEHDWLRQTLNRAWETALGRRMRSASYVTSSLFTDGLQSQAAEPLETRGHSIEVSDDA